MTMNTEKLRTELLEKREELKSLCETLSRNGEITLDQQVLGHVSRMDAMHQRALAQAADRQRKFEIRSIEEALRRIDEEEYGYCERCGDKISKGRLQVNPCALYCIRCAD